MTKIKASIIILSLIMIGCKDKKEDNVDYYPKTVYSVSAYYCDSNNKHNANRKPNTGMIKQYMDFVKYMNDDEDEEEKVVYDTILMIGDASGKEGQFSDSDKKTAENFGCEYMDVDDFVDKYKG